MKIKPLYFALLLFLATALGLFFGYKMGVKMRTGDHRILYPHEMVQMADSADSE